jgi:RNA polymerase-interacting CarD/CdnL/TRCF family regulator
MLIRMGFTERQIYEDFLQETLHQLATVVNIEAEEAERIRKRRGQST